MRVRVRVRVRGEGVGVEYRAPHALEAEVRPDDVLTPAHLDREHAWEM